MQVRDEVEMCKRIGVIKSNLELDGITNFQEFLDHHTDKDFGNLDSLEDFVNTYCTKVVKNRLNAIHDWERVIMLNALALYMIELNIEEPPIGEQMVNKLLKIYTLTIRNYNEVLKGTMKLNGPVFISDISLSEFTKFNGIQDKEAINRR